MRSGGVLYIELREKFHDSAANTAWVISLAVTVRMLFGKYESLLEQGFITTMFLILHFELWLVRKPVSAT